MKLRYLSCFAVVTFCFPWSVRPQTTTPPMSEAPPEFQRAHPAREDGDVELSISTARAPSVIRVGSDLPINIDLKNISPEPFRFHFTFAHNQAELNGFIAKVTNSAGEELPLVPPQPAGFRSKSSFVLQSGQVLHDHLVLNHLVDLSRPGTYTVRVKWKYRRLNKWVESNTITVVVKEG